MNICLFDIDGTLLASGGAGKLALQPALTERFGIPLGVPITHSGRTDRAIIRDLFAHRGIEHTPANFDKLLGGYLRRLPASLSAKNGCVLPGIADLLVLLKEREHVH